MSELAFLICLDGNWRSDQSVWKHDGKWHHFCYFWNHRSMALVFAASRQLHSRFWPENFVNDLCVAYLIVCKSNFDFELVWHNKFIRFNWVIVVLLLTILDLVAILLHHLLLLHLWGLDKLKKKWLTSIWSCCAYCPGCIYCCWPSTYISCPSGCYASPIPGSICCICICCCIPSGIWSAGIIISPGAGWPSGTYCMGSCYICCWATCSCSSICCWAASFSLIFKSNCLKFNYSDSMKLINNFSFKEKEMAINPGL